MLDWNWELIELGIGMNGIEIFVDYGGVGGMLGIGGVWYIEWLFFDCRGVGIILVIVVIEREDIMIFLWLFIWGVDGKMLEIFCLIF